MRYSFINFIKIIINYLGIKNIIFNLIKESNNSPKQDEDLEVKFIKLIEDNNNFGFSDFASLSPGLFSSSLQNHGTIHQRIDEASLLWMMVKKSKGKILELGRAAGGSTILILGASGDREVVSIDRDPRHLSIAKNVFNKSQVSQRLKLYNQTSRKYIDEDNYGFLFIDGDHSYEGICYDIACFWNQLECNSNYQGIAVFHDAQVNPISYVPAVVKAVNELIYEKAAIKIANWGSQLAVKKINNIDIVKWHQKIDEEFWSKKNSYLQNKILNPLIEKFSFSDLPKVNYEINLLGYENIDESDWKKVNLRVINTDLTADNPVKFISLNPHSKSTISKKLEKLFGKFVIEIYLRPKHLDAFNLTLSDQSGNEFLNLFNYFENNNPKVIVEKSNIEIIDIKVDYLNAYYHFYYHLSSNYDLINLDLNLIFNERLNDSGLYLNLISLYKEK